MNVLGSTVVIRWVRRTRRPIPRLKPSRWTFRKRQVGRSDGNIGSPAIRKETAKGKNPTSAAGH